MSAHRVAAGGVMLAAVLVAANVRAQETETPPPASGGNFFSKLFGGPEKPALDKLRGVAFTPSSQAIGVERDLLDRRAAGYGLVAAKGLEQYANEVLDKLKLAAGIPGLPGRVYIAATDDLSAVTTADGNIFISYRWFENLNDKKRGQEDTLAALLAHELGHIALGHHNSDFFANAGKWAQRYYAQGMALKTALEQKVNADVSVPLPEKAAKNLRKMQLIVEIMDQMVHPAWKRGQEEAADAFAVDLTKAAGYSYQEGVKRFLELNNSVAEKQAERDRVRLAAMQADVDASFKVGKIDVAFNGIGNQLSAQLTNLLTATHPDPAARVASLSAYVSKYYLPAWYEETEATVSDRYRKVVMDKHSIELFEMYNNAFVIENMFVTLKPEDVRAAVALGEKLTRKTGLKNVNRDNWLLFYEYARAMQLAADLPAEPAVAVAEAKPKGGKGKLAKAAAPWAEDPALKADELQNALVINEAAMSFKPYEDRINEELKMGRRDRALTLLAITDKRFELARSTLPGTIGLYVRAGKPERATELANYCVVNYMEMRDDCNKAAKAK